jgi:7,8-didemethyl-8-hydroxy-5-deazariboflavin synthase CofH subunit
VIVTFCRTAEVAVDADAAALGAAREHGATTLVSTTAHPTAPALAAGLLVVAGSEDGEGVAWLVSPADAIRLHDRGIAGVRITVRHEGPTRDVIDAAVRAEAAWVRADLDDVPAVVEMVDLPALSVGVSVAVGTLDEALDAVAAGASDIVISSAWTDETIGRLRDALPGQLLVERTALPLFVDIDAMRKALTPTEFRAWCNLTDGSGAARPRYAWAPGRDMPAPVPDLRFSAEWPDDAWTGRSAAVDTGRVRPEIAAILERSLDGTPPSESEVAVLFGARAAEVDAIAAVADELRERECGDAVSYVINRNINYTNQCYFKCGFCGFSRGPKSLEFRDDPYLLSIDNIVDRSKEAWDRGATEVCLVGGIHPSFDGNFYLDIVKSVKAELPDMHIHGFTPLEIWQGAATLDIDVADFLQLLKDAGLGTLPGTAAEILDDRVREHLCPDKLRTAEWAHVMIHAHRIGLRATSTIMHGHIDYPDAFARHYEVLREIQRRTGGFTEFVPLPFVHMGAPMYLQGRSRPGPTWDEVVLIHAVARIAFDGLIPNIQASWVKLGLDAGARLLDAGCNDIGGTLMNESISRASGAAHGQLATADELEAAVLRMGRTPYQRTTLYEVVDAAATT